MALPFTTLEGILKTEYTVGGSGASYDKFFLAPDGSIKRAIAEKRMNPDTKVETYEEAITKTLNEKFAFITSTSQMYVKNKDNCLFIDIPYDVQAFQVALAYQKKFPYAPLFDHAIKKSKENGQIDRILSKWMAKPRTDCASGSGMESMGWKNVISVFAMIGGGLMLSVFIFLIEIFLNIYKCN